MSQGLVIRQYQGQTGFSRIREPWLELMRSISRQCFYHHPAWFQAYFDRPGVREDMFFRCVYSGGQLIAVLPVYFQKRLGGLVQEAKLPDYDGLYMPDMAVSDDADLPVVWRELRAPSAEPIAPLWNIFSADSVLEDSAVAGGIRSAGDDIVRESTAGKCAVLDVLGYDEVLRRLKKKFRGNLNNAKHRLSAEADVAFLSVTKLHRLNWAFEKFVAVEQSGWKGKPDEVRKDYPRPAAIGLKKSKYDFYRNVVHEFGRIGALRILLLEVQGRTIGAQIYIQLKDTCYLVKTAFDEEFGKYSPGHLVLDFAFEQFAEAGGISRICLITDYEWFRYWNPRYVNYVRMKAFRRTATGRAVSAAYSLLRNQ